MAGGGEAEDNPVNMNVVAMVDIIFCLCVFFMCSFKFKQIEGKFDSWLPKDKGLGAMAPDTVIQEIRVAMFWDETAQKTTRQLGSRKVNSDDELQQLIRGGYDDAVRTGHPEIPVTIDADARVPWKDVITVVNLCKHANIDKIEFAFGAPAK